MAGLPDACYLPSVLDRKLQDAFDGAGLREAERALEGVPPGRRRIRVQLACLRLCAGDLARLRELVGQAGSGPDAVVAQAEDDGFVAWVMGGERA